MNNYFQHTSVRLFQTAVIQKMLLKPLLMAFDFDSTIIEENSDLIISNLYPNDLPQHVKELYSSDSGWITYMKSIFQLVKNIGIDQNKIIDVINSIPSVAGIEDLFKNLHSSNCDIIIISDANSVFIESWLKHKQLSHMINKIYTNPAWFDKNGLLNVKEYHKQDWCKLSEKNLCKGYVLQVYIKERLDEGVKFDKIAYVGDGRNDFCPMLKLTTNDIAFPRQDHYIIKMLDKYKNSDNFIKSEIIPWKDGNDIWYALKERKNL